MARLVIVLELHSVLPKLWVLWMHLQFHVVLLDQHLYHFWQLSEVSVILGLFHRESVVSIFENEACLAASHVVPDTPVINLLICVQCELRVDFIDSLLLYFASRYLLPMFLLARDHSLSVPKRNLRTAAQSRPQSLKICLSHYQFDDIWVHYLIDLIVRLFSFRYFLLLKKWSLWGHALVLLSRSLLGDGNSFDLAGLLGLNLSERHRVS